MILPIISISTKSPANQSSGKCSAHLVDLALQALERELLAELEAEVAHLPHEVGAHVDLATF